MTSGVTSFTNSSVSTTGGFTVGGMAVVSGGLGVGKSMYRGIKRKSRPCHYLGRADNPSEDITLLGYVHYPSDDVRRTERLYYTKQFLSNGGIRSRECSFVGLFNRKWDMVFYGVLVEVVK